MSTDFDNFAQGNDIDSSYNTGSWFPLLLLFDLLKYDIRAAIKPTVIH